MSVVGGAALATALAGFLVLVFGFVLGYFDLKLRQQLRSELEKPPEAPAGAQLGAWDPVQYVKALTDLAKSLAGLPQATQAFLIATILFAFTTAIALGDRLVD